MRTQRLFPLRRLLALALAAAAAHPLHAAPVISSVFRLVESDLTGPGVSVADSRDSLLSGGFNASAQAVTAGGAPSIASSTMDSVATDSGIEGGGTLALDVQPQIAGVSAAFVRVDFRLDAPTVLAGVINHLDTSNRFTRFTLLAGDASVGGLVGLEDIQQLDTDQLQFSRLLDPGAYRFQALVQLAGDGTVKQSAYDFSFAFQAPSLPPGALPEPRSLALVLLGLGLAATAAARRKA